MVEIGARPLQGRDIVFQRVANAVALLLVTAAPAFLPWGLAAGAVALMADVALSRLRAGHW